MRGLVSGVVVLFWCSTLNATMFLQKTENEMTDGANAICIVSAGKQRVEGSRSLIRTVVKLTKQSCTKGGDLIAKEFEVSFPGGQLPTGETTKIAGTPELQDGSTYQVFLVKDSKDTYWGILNWAAGVKKIADKAGDVSQPTITGAGAPLSLPKNKSKFVSE